MTVVRDNRIDAVAGLLILVMIAGHCDLISFDKYSVGSFFTFYMGWFFYKSGMFYSTTRLSKQVIVGLVKKLLVPFFIWTIIGFCIAVLYNKLNIKDLYRGGEKLVFYRNYTV